VGYCIGLAAAALMAAALSPGETIQIQQSSIGMVDGMWGWVCSSRLVHYYTEVVSSDC
jgi:hypothetical protein